MVEKLMLNSLDITSDKINQLKKIMPEVFTDGKIDFQKFQQILGKQIETDQERYGLSWAGKNEAIKNIQTQSTGTLRPILDESINFDKTSNILVEGDNLEVLKLLQRSYYGKVKMIYIDPPYNTGNEFIYPDNYREGLVDYLKYTGQIDEMGIKQSTNSETSGRYHSKWLSMMYPRLFLARNLLKEDGLIFVSIDDHEYDNLKKILDEIFGEESYLGTLIWKRRQNVDSRSKNGISQDHEYIVCYGRSISSKLRGKDKDLDKYSNPDNDPRGLWMSDNMVGLATKEQRPNLHYDLTDPITNITYSCPPTGWRYEPKRMKILIENGEVIFPKNPDGRPRRKKFLKDLESNYTGFSTILDTVFNTQGTREVRQIFNEQEVFDFPKPVGFIQELLRQGLGEEDRQIVLDFFAGSGSTAHALMNLNASENKEHQYILVQLPEQTPEKSAARSFGFSKMSDITKERVRRVIYKFQQEEQEGLQFDNEHKVGLGFKVFKLDSSNFKVWDGSKVAAQPDQIEEQLDLFVENVKDGRSELDILYEIVLKSGFNLTTKIEEVELAGERVYSVAEKSLFVCLLDRMNKNLIQAMVEEEPEQVVCLDMAFHEQDELKTNTVLEMKSRTIKFRTV
ncbi:MULTISPECIES: DNA methyltransferase [Robertmurraya]|uniref:Site-specific DNA-methyltransferase n=1 Tax=Robertmurraya beringensis TaxID=641660 RepID=A0ABV6KVX0_9BACI